MTGLRRSKHKPRRLIGAADAMLLSLLDETTDREFLRRGMLPPRMQIRRALAEKLERTTAAKPERPQR